MGETASGLLPPGIAAAGTGVAPRDEGGLVGAGPLLQKLEAPSPVEKPALSEGALCPVIAKHGKILTGEPSAVVDDKRMHMAVGAVVIMDRRDKLNGMP